MADKPLPWFRAYPEAAFDPKFDIISRQTGIDALAVFGAWWKILCLAGSSPVRGSLYVTFQKRYTIDDVTAMLRIGNDQSNVLMTAFIDLDMLDIDEAGAYHVTNWEKRQFESDSSTERVRKHRAKAKEKRSKSVTVTPPDSETEAETETENNSDPAPLLPEIEIYREVTGLVPDYMHEQEVIQNVRSIRNKHQQPPREVLLGIMKEKYSTWLSSTTTDGRPYNPSNPKWLEWCVTGYSPKPEKPANGKRPGLRGI